VTQEFSVDLAHPVASGEPLLRVAHSQGVSWADSDDGATTIGLLGTVGREADARRIACSPRGTGQRPTVVAAGEAGHVIVEHAARRVTVVAPEIGLRQMYWHAAPGRLRLGSDARSVATSDDARPAIRPAALFDYVYFHMLPGPGSIYEGVAKLEAGHSLDWDGHQAQIARYWQPRFLDDSPVPEAEAADELRQVLAAAVDRCLATPARAGAFLSGGLDSSTVAGLAARQRPGIATVSMGFDAQGYDEMQFARIAARRFGTTPLEYYVTPQDVLDTLPQIAASFAEPFGNSSAAAAYHCARVAREHGLELLLAGDGGDELFGGNERYAQQLVFERYGHVPAGLRHGLLEPLLGRITRITQAFPFGKAASYVAKAKVPLPDRLQSYNFLHRHPAHEVFEPQLLACVDAAAPLELLREEYRAPHASSAVDRMLFLDWKFTLQDNDLVKVNTMCRLGGVAVAYPMLDPAVVDFSLRIPADWKVHKGELRWFYKRAMRGFLPDEIIGKRKHGFGLPFGVWTRTHAGLQRLSADALGSLAGRGYFRPEFLQSALRLHREGHASYYGELVWILTVLELWLRAHAPDARL
jgi:asparagine synthase (glutamine-hydrolysing)